MFTITNAKHNHSKYLCCSKQNDKLGNSPHDDDSKIISCDWPTIGGGGKNYEPLTNIIEFIIKLILCVGSPIRRQSS